MLDQSIQDFTHKLASPAPVPGGGGTSALAGALGSALGAMAASLTVNKKKFIDVQPLMQQSMDELRGLSDTMLGLIQADADAFEPLSRTYGLPRETAEEKAARERILQECLQSAAQPPLDIMRACKRALGILGELSGTVSRLVVSDVGCGAALCRACMEAASLNVYINAKMITDPVLSQALFGEAKALVDEGRRAADTIFSQVEEELCRQKS